MNEIEHYTEDKIDLKNDFFKKAIVSDLEMADGSMQRVVTFANMDFDGLETLCIGIREGFSHNRFVKKIKSSIGSFENGKYKQFTAGCWVDITHKEYIKQTC